LSVKVSLLFKTDGIKPISEAAAAAKIKKAEEMGAAQGNMSAMKKMMSGK
jgi:hypothetical protein